MLRKSVGCEELDCGFGKTCLNPRDSNLFAVSMEWGLPCLISSIS